MHVPFSVAYGTSRERVREAWMAAAAKVARVVEDANRRSSGRADRLRRQLDGLRAGGLVVWADRELTTHPARTHAQLMWALDDELHRMGIEIPLPQRDLNIRSGVLDVRMAPETAQAPRPGAA